MLLLLLAACLPRAAATCPATVADAPPGVLVRVEKQAFELGVYRDGRLLDASEGPACFPIALGAAPAGDKQARGDERTPDGELRVTHRNPASRFYKSLGLNYPTTRHADAGLAAGRIDAATAARVKAADAPGKMPARDTALGGDIYIHGGGSAWRSWTDGCIALENDAMDYVYDVAGPGSAVWVLP